MILNLLASEEEIVSFLRAFWDDEGTICIDYRSKSLKLRGRQKSAPIRQVLIELHRRIGIKAKEDYDKKGVIISRKEDIIKFSREIGFSQGVKVGESVRGTHTGKNKVELLEESIKKIFKA